MKQKIPAGNCHVCFFSLSTLEGFHKLEFLHQQELQWPCCGQIQPQESSVTWHPLIYYHHCKCFSLFEMLILIRLSAKTDKNPKWLKLGIVLFILLTLQMTELRVRLDIYWFKIIHGHNFNWYSEKKCRKIHQKGFFFSDSEGWRDQMKTTLYSNRLLFFEKSIIIIIIRQRSNSEHLLWGPRLGRNMN